MHPSFHRILLSPRDTSQLFADASGSGQPPRKGAATDQHSISLTLVSGHCVASQTTCIIKCLSD